MEITIHRASSRGHFNHGWLDTFHTFSFSEYFDPNRVNFGSLRVLNDDRVQPGKGFDLHAHHNMEIVTIPLHGELEHQDSMGNKSSIIPGEIQVMSAGTGIRHSEYNRSQTDTVEFLQIWVLPEKQNLPSRYENGSIRSRMIDNAITEFVSPYPGTGNGLWIHQRAWFSYGKIEKGHELTYDLKSPFSYGIYIFMIEGSLKIANTKLKRRDGAGITRSNSIKIKGTDHAEFIVIEVPPMK